MDEKEKPRELQDQPVAKMDLREKDTALLVELAAAKKRKMDFAKAEMDVVTAEIQSRAIQFQEDRHIKFTEWKGTERALASVTVAQTFDVLNFYKLKELLGKELVEEKIRVKPQEIKYDVDASFKKALTAIILDDYENKLTVREVIERAGWCEDSPERKAALLKKLKGDYKKDKKAVLDALNMQDGEIDIDTELYCIYQIKNWELIRAYCDESDFDAVAEAVKRCIAVDETAKIGLRVG